MKKILHTVRKYVSQQMQQRRLISQWRQLSKKTLPVQGNPDRLILIPCDPWSVWGSRGDDAMIAAVIQRFPGRKIGVITASAEASASVREKGWEALEVWRGTSVLRNIIAEVERFSPECAVVLGADVMDGYYSPEVSLILLFSADLLRRRGIRTSLLGFSFNATPAPAVLRALSLVDRNFIFNLRDANSLKRFESLGGRAARLTADTAFLLHPQLDFSEYEEVLRWRKQRGRQVLVVNYHPMLRKNVTPAEIDEQILSLGNIAERILDAGNWDLLLLGHDYRPGIGDHRCLEPLYNRLAMYAPERVYWVKPVLNAAQLKGIVGLGDALLTARMHLGIGALSQGIPVAGFSYQDKFHGLFSHFQLPEQYLLPAPSRDNEAMLANTVQDFLVATPELRRKIQHRLPDVIKLAEMNLEFSS